MAIVTFVPLMAHVAEPLYMEKFALATIIQHCGAKGVTNFVRDTFVIHLSMRPHFYTIHYYV